MAGVFDLNQPKPVYLVDADTGKAQSQNQDVVNCGEVAGSVTAIRFPSSPGNYVRLKAMPQNLGNIYIGGNDGDGAGTKKRTGLTDATTGFPLSPGEDTGWLPVSNLDEFWHIDDSATDSIAYMVLS